MRKHIIMAAAGVVVAFVTFMAVAIAHASDDDFDDVMKSDSEASRDATDETDGEDDEACLEEEPVVSDDESDAVED